MRQRHFRHALPLLGALAVLPLVPASGHAQERSTPALSLHGFGTVGAVYSSEDRADFVWNPLQPNGPGHSGTISPDVDSRLGLQLSAYLVEFLGRSAVEVKAHWSKLIFTGRGRPPQKLSGDEAVRRRVAEDSSAIGYIDIRAVDSSVRVLRIDG